MRSGMIQAVYNLFLIEGLCFLVKVRVVDLLEMSNVHLAACRVARIMVNRWCECDIQNKINCPGRVQL